MKINKIEVFTEVNKYTIVVSEHAIKQAVKRFKLNMNKSKVSEWIRNKFNGAEFYSTITSERYGLGRMYINDNIAIILDAHKDIILTVYELDIHKNVRSKIRKFLDGEVNRINKKLHTKKRSYDRKMIKLNLEKAKLQNSLLYMRNKNNITNANNRIAEIEEEINSMLKELYDLQMEKEEFKISMEAPTLKIN